MDFLYIYISAVAVAAWQWQPDSGSLAVAAWQWQPGSGSGWVAVPPFSLIFFITVDIIILKAKKHPWKRQNWLKNSKKNSKTHKNVTKMTQKWPKTIKNTIKNTCFLIDFSGYAHCSRIANAKRLQVRFFTINIHFLL
jgi:hypothetical protein